MNHVLPDASTPSAAEAADDSLLLRAQPSAATVRALVALAAVTWLA